MSQSSSAVSSTITWVLPFWFFVTVKVMGTAFAAWSWWWVLLPIVPAFSLVVKAWAL
jgi:hypothetical protein